METRQFFFTPECFYCYIFNILKLNYKIVIITQVVSTNKKLVCLNTFISFRYFAWLFNFGLLCISTRSTVLLININYGIGQIINFQICKYTAYGPTDQYKGETGFNIYLHFKIYVNKCIGIIIDKPYQLTVKMFFFYYWHPYSYQY